jgi:hypothetical protein
MIIYLVTSCHWQTRETTTSAFKTHAAALERALFLLNQQREAAGLPRGTAEFFNGDVVELVDKTKSLGHCYIRVQPVSFVES